MKEYNYHNGYVTIDASDWYINDEMVKALKKDSSIDITPYKEYYLKHILEHANYYNNLSKQLTNREINHTLLIHHTLLNALFLDSLIVMFKNAGWELINASEAYKDSISLKFP